MSSFCKRLHEIEIKLIALTFLPQPRPTLRWPAHSISVAMCRLASPFGLDECVQINARMTLARWDTAKCQCIWSWPPHQRLAAAPVARPNVLKGIEPIGLADTCQASAYWTSCAYLVNLFLSASNPIIIPLAQYRNVMCTSLLLFAPDQHNPLRVESYHRHNTHTMSLSTLKPAAPTTLSTLIRDLNRLAWRRTGTKAPALWAKWEWSCNQYLGRSNQNQIPVLEPLWALKGADREKAAGAGERAVCLFQSCRQPTCASFIAYCQRVFMRKNKHTKRNGAGKGARLCERMCCFVCL